MNLPTIGFIGCGHMAQAIISGLLADENNTFPATNILATCQSQASANRASELCGIECRADNQWLIQQADIIILAVKPQQIRTVLEEITSYDLNEKIIVTLAAAINSTSYRKFIGDDLPLIRAMPNVGAEVNASLTGIYTDQDLSDEDAGLIEAIFSTVGEIAWLDDEVQIDGITAITGSGIAYFFRFMQAMAKAGEQYGFERDEVYDLVTLTAMGAATLALENDAEKPDFADLCRSVAVEGGTTAQALAVFEQAELDRVVTQAMDAVVNKSTDLRQSLTKDW
ncbi:pyrroline-5-carboxylate reductase [Cardiobacteriaceae bacterium TAE3-ERU3]|nr:pyrroline-5-carboxylate reductase [Cardiobacteriaceae bacterium TAE3-ERU3]